MEVLINRCYGGFGVSRKAINLYNKRSGSDITYDFELDSHRSDPILIDIFKELGEEAGGSFANVVIEEIPDGYDYQIYDYDGLESIHLILRENILRDLIRLGNEDDIVNYVMRVK